MSELIKITLNYDGSENISIESALGHIFMLEFDSYINVSGTADIYYMAYTKL